MLAFGASAPVSAVYSAPPKPVVVTTVANVGIDQTQERWLRVLRALHGFYDLVDSWDGQGAAAPSPSLTTSAIRVAEYLRFSKEMPPTSVVATPAGTVLLAWHGTSCREIEVVDPDHVEEMIVGPDGKATHREI